MVRVSIVSNSLFEILHCFLTALSRHKHNVRKIRSILFESPISLVDMYNINTKNWKKPAALQKNWWSKCALGLWFYRGIKTNALAPQGSLSDIVQLPPVI
jgi:hypothetical protein